jgi:hypothetical protein
MLYLLDASTLITAHNTYYPVGDVPEFWEWLAHHAGQGDVKMPLEIFEEVKGGPDGTKDPLFAWIQTPAVKKALVLSERVDGTLIQRIIDKGYAPDLTDIEAENLGRDPFLVAYALADVANRTVVTSEVSKTTKTRHNRKLPDVCDTMAAKWCDPFAFNRALKFGTRWKEGLG